MGLSKTFGWLEVDRIAEALNQTHARVDPVTLRFTQLREMVEKLPGFEPNAKHPVNERILEAIQAAWLDERDDAPSEDED